MCLNNPYWQSGGIIKILCKYDIVISDTLTGSWMCFSWVTENSTKKNLREEHHLMATRPSYVIFFCFFCTAPHPIPPHPYVPPFPPPVHPASKSRINDGFIYRGRVTTRVAIRKVWMLENMTIRLFCSLHLNW